MSAPRVILVTGASSGFGRALVDLILETQDIVVAALRKPEVLADLSSTHGTDKLLVIKLDITVESERKDAFDQIKSRYGRLDVVINNAGVVGAVGEIEGSPIDAARKTFETNFWGTLDMTVKSVEFMRDVNKPGEGGKIIGISSPVAYQPFPGVAYYNASKAALESAVGTLAAEIDPTWGVKLSLVQPGAYGTSAFANASVNPVHSAYTSASLPATAMRGMLAAGPEAFGDPLAAAKVILKIANIPKDDLPLRHPVGSHAVGMILGATQSVIDDVEKSKVLAAEGDKA